MAMTSKATLVSMLGDEAFPPLSIGSIGDLTDCQVQEQRPVSDEACQFGTVFVLIRWR